MADDTVVESWLELDENGDVRRKTNTRGRMRTYHNNNVSLGHIDEIEKKRPDLLPFIRNYKTPENRGIVPEAKRIKLEQLPMRLGRIKDPAIVKAMMRADDRPEAELHYIRRLEKILSGEQDAQEAEVEEGVTADV